MNNPNFFFDTVEFDRKFAEFIKTVPVEFATQGLADAAFALLVDADDDKPQAPYKTGDLRASRKIEKPTVTGSAVEVKAGYNMKYAARLHEGEPTWKWTTTQVSQPGPKFLESKLVANAKKYMGIAVDYIRTKIEAGRA